MHTAFCIAALAGVAYSAPQLINLDAIAADFAPPVLVEAPVNVVSNIPSPSVPPEILPLQSASAKKRNLEVEKRDGDCSPYPTGPGPVPTPDTPAAFQSDPDFATMANNAPTPDGYALVFNNLGASLQASNYMGLYTLTSYDTLTCASLCDQASGCSAFNVYLERDPTLNANAVSCPNPPSTTNYKCTLWGAPVSSAEATNSGQYQDSFEVVIAGSNGYNKDSPPPAISGFVGPQELGGAINAPTSSGSYMGYQFFPFSQSQGYDPQTCADACNTQTTYDSQHPAADGSYMSCVFFNAYVLSENAIPQGLYCSMYNETWGPSYGTNYGQYRGSDRYTVSESYSYTLSSYYDTYEPPQGSVYTFSSASPATSAVTSTSNPSSFSSFASSTPPTSAITAVSSLTSSATSASPYYSSLSTSATPSSSAVTTKSSQASSSMSTSASSQASPPASSSAAQSTSASTSTCVPTPSNNVVQNGGFECGISPWIAADVTDTKHSISSPGDNSVFAYEFDQTGAMYSSTNPASVSQNLVVTVGQAYTLTFRTYFDQCTQSEGFVGVMLNNAAVYTVDACDFGAGAYESNTVTFTATVSPLNLQFQFVVGEPTAVVKIDNVVVVPVSVSSPASTLSSASITTTASASSTLSSASITTTISASSTASISPSASASASCGNPVIQNGGFETGILSPWTVTNQIGGNSYSIVTPGSTKAGGGNYAFYANLQTPNSPYNGVSSLTLQQTLSTCAGTNYSISVDYKLDVTNLGPCSIMLVYPYKTTTGSVTENSNVSPVRVWDTMVATFQAVSNADLLKIVLSCTAGNEDIEVDNVKVAYYPGNAF